MHPLLATHAAEAARRLTPDVHRYFAGGAGDQVSLDEAERAWSQLRLRPRVLRDVATVETGLELLGTALATPVLCGPAAAHGLAHPEGEVATARGVAEAGSLMVLSTRSSVAIDEVRAPGPWWWQAYVVLDHGLTRERAARAADAGARAVVLTGDVPYLGARHGATRLDLTGRPDPRDRQDPSIGLEAIDLLARASGGLPVLVKGVLRGDDALACLDAGAAGVVVSNHGGRQLDRAAATAEVLAEVVDAVDGRAPVLVDGGLRSGLDVLCALALGADAVLLARPVLWALAVGGADGVRDCLGAVTEELRHCMGLAGCSRLADIGPDLLHRRP
ncbi:MAG: L-lactate dehydrogenase [uncultured Frankineae bacterium]|uniref:L-lactate dehydrogenase n=1 Tax=uncultured Frankineae bacterium TaxID=437475 RepID=A0A6J4KGS1_9ACTN|nr:MAG: L-lactate dehydrogenase [uncultured Frankineae bacterium]